MTRHRRKWRRTAHLSAFVVKKSLMGSGPIPGKREAADSITNSDFQKLFVASA
jgi:hypothetical protein